MKILLDIDGVMIPAKSWQAHKVGSDGFGMFSKYAVDGLNQIIDSALSPEIILTTSHKHKFSIKEWQVIFRNRGINAVKIGRLDTDTLSISRLQEIQSWYLKNQNELFIIIDDDKQLNKLDYNFKEDHLVLTIPTVGLNKLSTLDVVNKIKQIQETV